MGTAGLYLDPSGSAGARLQAGRTLELSSPVQEGGATLFRSTLYLLVPVDAACQRIAVAPGSGLALRFEPLTVGIGEHDGAWVTKWVAEANRVTVGLSRPAPVTRVRSRIYGRVMLYRVDGDAVAGQPTFTVATGDPLSEPFVAAAFQAAFDEEKLESVAEVVTAYVEEQQRYAMSSKARARASGSQTAHPTDDAGWKQVKQEAMVHSILEGLDVSGSPSTPRLRLLDGDGGESLWQWLSPGEHQEAVEFGAEGEALAAAWEPALARALAKLRKEGSGTLLSLPLHVESDAPCRVVVEQASVGFVWEGELQGEAVPLRYEGATVETKLVPLAKPSATPLWLALAGSVGGLAPFVCGAPQTLDSKSRYTGAALLEGEQLAVGLTIEEPLRLAGLALAWAPLSERVGLRVSLLADAGGEPAAAPLVEGSVETTLSDPAWLQCRFSGAPVQPGRYWVQVRAEAGLGVWLGEPATQPMPVWRQGASGDAVASTLPLKLLFELCEEATAAFAVPPLTFALNGVPFTSTLAGPPRFEARLDPLPAPLAVARDWNLEVTSPQSLVGALQSVRLGYSLE